MTLEILKISIDERATAERKRLDTGTAQSDQPIDPRPLPLNHHRHLDVDRVLARSLPALSHESDSGAK